MIDIIATLEIMSLSSAFTYFASAIAFKIFGNRLKNTLYGWINEYVEDFVAEIKEKPEFVESLLEQPIKRLLPKIAAEFTSKEGKGTEMIPSGAAGLAMTFLPKKWRGLASLFMGSQGTGSNSTDKNPFG